MTNLTFNGSNNLGGIWREFYFVPASYVNLIPDVLDNVISGLIPLGEEGAGSWFKGYMTLETISFTEEKVEGDQGVLYNQVFSGFFPKDSPGIAALLNDMANDRFLVLYKDNNDYFKLIGDIGQPLMFDRKMATDTKVGGSNGYNISFTGQSSHEAYFYTGTINVYEDSTVTIPGISVTVSQTGDPGLFPSNFPYITGDNLAGNQNFFFVSLQKVLSIPDVLHNIISGTIELKDAASWIEGYMTLETISYTEEKTEGDQGVLYNPVFTGFCPKDTPEMADIFAQMSWDRFLILYQDNNGYFKLIGDMEAGLTFDRKMTTDTKVAGSNGYTITFSGQCSHEAYFFTGTFPAMSILQAFYPQLPVPLATGPAMSDTAITAARLTGLGTPINSPIISTDSILLAFEHTQGQINYLQGNYEPKISIGTATQYWRGDKTWQTLNTDVVPEGTTNLYYTLARVRGNVSATSPLVYSSTTGIFSIPTATTSVDGYLSHTDWNTFNGKQAAGNYITALTGDVTASGPGSVAATVAKINGATLGSTTPTLGYILMASGSQWVSTPQTSITALGTIGTGSWQASLIPMSYGGTSANLTASNGGIVWTNASQMQVLSANANSGLALVSGGAGAPTWFAPTASCMIYATTNGALTYSTTLTYSATSGMSTSKAYTNSFVGISGGVGSGAAISLTGEWASAVSSTSPQLMIVDGAATAASWSNAGIAIGVNAYGGTFGGGDPIFLDLKYQGVTQYSLASKSSAGVGTGVIISAPIGATWNIGNGKTFTIQPASSGSVSTRFTISALMTFNFPYTYSSGAPANAQAVSTYNSTITNTSGSGTGSTMAIFNLSPTINQTTGTTATAGQIWGIYINPTISAVGNFVALESTYGRYIITTTNAGSVFSSGAVGIGFNLGASTLTDTTTSTGATPSQLVAHSVSAPTFTSPSNTITVASLYTFWIEAPLTSGHTSATDKYALGVNGRTYHADRVAISTTATTVTGGTSGTATFYQDFDGASWKTVQIYCSTLNGAAVYTFPKAFTNVPQVLSQNLAATVTAISTTSVTVTGAASTGFILLIGF